MERPNLDLETRLWAEGRRWVAGLDEAGRGAWAGPVVAAAVVLPRHDPSLADRLEGVRDSKQLSPAQRERLMERIVEAAVCWGVGVVPAHEIDAMGIVPATRQAMEQALAALRPPADALLIDYVRLPGTPLPQHCLPKGDALVLSIAAASIVAKVHRDRLMIRLDAEIPGYGLGRHKGYGTAEHRAALAALGPSEVHRRSFAPVHEVCLELGLCGAPRCRPGYQEERL